MHVCERFWLQNSCVQAKLCNLLRLFLGSIHMLWLNACCQSNQVEIWPIRKPKIVVTCKYGLSGEPRHRNEPNGACFVCFYLNKDQGDSPGKTVIQIRHCKSIGSEPHNFCFIQDLHHFDISHQAFSKCVCISKLVIKLLFGTHHHWPDYSPKMIHPFCVWNGSNAQPHNCSI